MQKMPEKAIMDVCYSRDPNLWVYSSHTLIVIEIISDLEEPLHASLKFMYCIFLVAMKEYEETLLKKIIWWDSRERSFTADKMLSSQFCLLNQLWFHRKFTFGIMLLNSQGDLTGHQNCCLWFFKAWES